MDDDKLMFCVSLVLATWHHLLGSRVHCTWVLRVPVNTFQLLWNLILLSFDFVICYLALIFSQNPFFNEYWHFKAFVLKVTI